MRSIRKTLITIAELHYAFGLIGHDEFNERVDIALWIDNKLADDPRGEFNESSDQEATLIYAEKNLDNSIISRIDTNKTTINNKENWIDFVCLGIWVFTKSDPDSYPSVPHGHFRNQNAPWPKLDPYTGRVFTNKHQENIKMRLTKKQFNIIWTDEKFKSFCREMIVWYLEKYPYHVFPVRRPLRMPKV